MNKVVVFGITLLGFFTLGCYAYFRLPELTHFDVMIDRHGRWRIPTNGGVTKIANAMIKAFPRLDSSFSFVEDSQFDMDNKGYLDSTKMYVILFGIIGVIFAGAVSGVIIGRYCCGCCGGKDVRRKGYPENQINFFRYTIIIISFMLEGILIYGYFANTDLHKSLSSLTDSFVNVSQIILKQMEVINLPTEQIPEIPDSINVSVFKKDFEFSSRYAAGQIDNMKSFLDKFEVYRMIIIIGNLVAATFGCSLGIAAGSVKKGTLVLIMVILFIVADLLFFFSFGIHFAGSKIIFEFCEDIGEFIDPSVDDMIPMRLQYFIPCVNSPIFPFVKNWFYFNALKSVEKFNTDCKAKLGADSEFCEATWNTFGDSKYKNKFANDETLKDAYKQTLNLTTQMGIVSNSATCKWSKEQLSLDRWLLCTFAKDNLDMIMLTQLAGCVVLSILTIIGIPAIKRFKFAGNANLGGVLDGNKRFMGKHARAKR